MNGTHTSQAQEKKPHPRLQHAYDTALLQFQAYLLEKKLAGEATLTKSHLMDMLSCN